MRDFKYTYSVGQQVTVHVKGDEYEGRSGRVVQQHHGRNVLEFPNGDRADYIDAELKKT